MLLGGGQAPGGPGVGVARPTPEPGLGHHRAVRSTTVGQPGGAGIPEIGQLATAPAGHPVGVGAVGPEAAQDVGVGERGELAQGAHPQTVEQFGQVGPAEDAHGERRQERGRAPGGDDHPAPGGQHGGEEPVADADLGGGDGGRRGADQVDQGLLAPEVAGRPPGGQ